MTDLASANPDARKKAVAPTPGRIIKVGPREIGHLHGDHAAHFSFPRALWSELHWESRIVDHPVFPGKVGPAARRISNEYDVRDVIALMRLNYDRIVERHGIPDEAE